MAQKSLFRRARRRVVKRDQQIGDHVIELPPAEASCFDARTCSRGLSLGGIKGSVDMPRHLRRFFLIQFSGFVRRHRLRDETGELLHRPFSGEHFWDNAPACLHLASHGKRHSGADKEFHRPEIRRPQSASTLTQRQAIRSPIRSTKTTDVVVTVAYAAPRKFATHQQRHSIIFPIRQPTSNRPIVVLHRKPRKSEERAQRLILPTHAASS